MDPLPLPEFAPVKRCSMCKEWKPIYAFHRNRSRRDGVQNRCKPCNIERNKRWYREHPDARGRRMDEYSRARKRMLQRLLLAYLRTHPCVDCGETDPVVLEFDHLRDKLDNISTMIARRVGWRTILTEIEKCEVVCANCHRRRTAERVGAYGYILRDSD